SFPGAIWEGAHLNSHPDIRRLRESRRTGVAIHLLLLILYSFTANRAGFMDAMTRAVKPQPGKLSLRPPQLEDGAAVWELIRACGPLDDNSMYCNFLQCDHFADTCVVAELDGEIVGWVSGYILPAEP